MKLYSLPFSGGEHNYVISHHYNNLYYILLFSFSNIVIVIIELPIFVLKKSILKKHLLNSSLNPFCQVSQQDELYCALAHIGSKSVLH